MCATTHPCPLSPSLAVRLFWVLTPSPFAQLEGLSPTLLDDPDSLYSERLAASAHVSSVAFVLVVSHLLQSSSFPLLLLRCTRCLLPLPPCHFPFPLLLLGAHPNDIPCSSVSAPCILRSRTHLVLSSSLLYIAQPCHLPLPSTITVIQVTVPS